MGEQIVFLVLALVTLFPAVMVVTTRNVFHAGLWLLPTLVGVAGLFLTLGAEFIAAVQVLIYVGGIMVLLLFAILLTRGISNPDIRSHTHLELWAFFAAAALGVVLVYSLYCQFGTVFAEAPPPAGTTENVGEALLTRYLLPFEIASLVLLSAIIGAIVLARGDKS